VHFYTVRCGGTESSLSECNFNSSSSMIGCPSDNYVSLRCCTLLLLPSLLFLLSNAIDDRAFPPLASIRMLGGSGPFGVIEIFNGRAWGPVCDERFNLVDGDIACRQLGFTGALSIIHNS